MLVRALKVLRFLCLSTKPARSSTRQPLISRAMKAALMAEQVHFGNDEPSNQLVRLMTGWRVSAPPALPASPERQDNMSISTQSIRSFVNFKRIGAVRDILALTAIAFTAAMSNPAAAGTRPGAYDGNWNVTFTTRAGNCGSNNSAPFNVSGTQVSSAGGGKDRRRHPQRSRFRSHFGRHVGSGRQGPFGRQLRNRPLERRHLRRPLQRDLAGQ
jgi:hypothetical protein